MRDRDTLKFILARVKEEIWLNPSIHPLLGVGEAVDPERRRRATEYQRRRRAEQKRRREMASRMEESA